MGTATKTKKLPTLSFNSTRRFGVEIELNAFDGLSRPDGGRARPMGIEEVCKEVQKHAEEGCEIRTYEHTEKNNSWVIKPDGSCGMEVVTPPFKGWRGVMKVCKVVDAFRVHPKIKADHRCSVHVHAEVADLSDEQLAAVVAWWIKCESVLIDAMPIERKMNRYCQKIGMLPLLQHDSVLTPRELIERISEVKYYTLNGYLMKKSGYKRKTIEARIAEAAGCTDPYLVKNWIRLFLHFIEMTSRRGMPEPYRDGDPMTGYCWLDPEDVLKVLGFSDNPQVNELSKGLTQTRNWFLARLKKYLTPDTEEGLPRYVAYRELQEILARSEARGVPIREEDHLSPAELADAVYGEDTKY